MTTTTDKLTFIKRAEEGFLIIVFPDNQVEVEAPYLIHREDGFFIVEGINNEQKVTYVIPDGDGEIEEVEK
jgi:hypothetical protein